VWSTLDGHAESKIHSRHVAQSSFERSVVDRENGTLTGKRARDAHGRIASGDAPAAFLAAPA
jgi:hypothetical protein